MPTTNVSETSESKESTLTRELKADLIHKDSRIADLQDQIKTLKALNSQIDARTKDLRN